MKPILSWAEIDTPIVKPPKCFSHGALNRSETYAFIPPTVVAYRGMVVASMLMASTVVTYIVMACVPTAYTVMA